LAIRLRVKRPIAEESRFVSEHAGLVSSLRAAFVLPDSGWKEVTQDHFVTLSHNNLSLPKRQRKDLQQLWILAESQIGNIDPSDASCMLFTPSTFLEKFLVFDQAWC